ncbi:hypothetical protein HDV05_001736 [Chytridiales sp. JEL 0842]|nr:hypothetical protein HDV05_001736 [Chytridiales sp. JEL 0842]
MGASGQTSNPLLVKSSVGKTRPTVFDLPGIHHVYGKKVERDPQECAAQVLQHWSVKAKSKHAVPALDYISMNRNSAKQGLISPQDIRLYRKDHPVRLKIGDNASTTSSLLLRKNRNSGTVDDSESRRQMLLGTLPHDADPNFTYGKPTRPSTPVALLMTDRYQREWIDEQERRQAEQQALSKEKAKKKQTKTVTPRKVPLPKKQVLVDKDPKTLFKMARFLKVGSKISSWSGVGEQVKMAAEMMRNPTAGVRLEPLENMGEMKSALEEEQEEIQKNVRFVEATA